VTIAKGSELNTATLGADKTGHGHPYPCNSPRPGAHRLADRGVEGDRPTRGMVHWARWPIALGTALRSNSL